MYNYSTAFYRELENDNRRFLIKMGMTIKDLNGNEKVIEIDNSNIMEGSMRVDSATSEVGTFCVGSLVATSLSFTLYNENEEYSDYDFIDGVISLEVGLMVGDYEEMVQYGIYTITTAKFSDNAISIEALDNLSRLSHNVEEDIQFPTDLNTIIRTCCNACSVPFDASSIPSMANTYTVERFDLSSQTYASLVSYCAQILARFVKATPYGVLKFGWYNLNDIAQDFDGGTLSTLDTPYSDGVNLDGGSFKYNDGDEIDGGSFSGFDRYHVINETSTADIDTDDIVITGVQVTNMPLEGEENTVLVGTDTYVVDIRDNPLIQAGMETTVANNILDNIVGMRFRTLECSILSNPAIEAGDVAVVGDYKLNYYTCFVSNYSFCPDGLSTISCDAMSTNRQRSSVASASAQLLSKSKKWIANEKSAREIALDNLATITANSLGFFSTDVVQSSGGVIRYMHNKPSLEESDTQWKITEQGFVVSTDFGETWNAGFDKDGNAVVNVLSAVGINAEWIKVGVLEGQTLRGGLVEGSTIISESPEGKTKIQGGTFESNNVRITGGEIRIASTEESWDYIQLLTRQKGMNLSPECLNLFEFTGTWKDFGEYVATTRIECDRIWSPEYYISEGGYNRYPPKMTNIKDIFITREGLANKGDKAHPIYFDENGNPQVCTPYNFSVGYADTAYSASRASYADRASRADVADDLRYGGVNVRIYLATSDGDTIALTFHNGLLKSTG